MKIRRIIATELRVPARAGTINSPSLDRPLHKLPQAGRPGWSMQFDELPKLILRLELGDGTLGLGECYRDHDWPTVAGIAEGLLGRDVRELTLQSLPIAWCREHDGFELAIWDAFAKAHALRLVDLLGGPVRTQVPVGAWSGHRQAHEVGDLAQGLAKQGFDCLKFKCDLRDDVVSWCRAVAEAAPELRVILDPNERWESPREVMRRLEALAACGNVLCLEDPLPRWMLHEYARLRGRGGVGIVLHVSLPYIAHGQRIADVLLALRQDAVDGFNFNGGLAHFQQLAHLSAAAGLPCWHGSEIDLGILEAAYVHACAAAESCTWPSDIFGRLIREHDLLAEPLALEPPVVHLPEGPGLGVTLDEQALAHYRTDEKVFQ